MSYDSLERSNIQSIPVSLYHFRLGTSEWFYASGEDEVVISSGPAAGTYLPIPIMDEGIKESGKPDDDTITIIMPKSLPVPQLYVGVAPSDSVYVIARRMNIGNKEAPVMWTGSVRSSKQTELTTAEVICVPELASFKRKGVRLAYTRNCTHTLYDHNCRVDKTLWQIGFAVTSLTGRSVMTPQIDALPPGRFRGGYIEWQTALGYIERRAIEDHPAGSFVIMEGTQGLLPGTFITAYPGCNLTKESCISYQNLANYGGFTDMPGRSPFDGMPVF